MTAAGERVPLCSVCSQFVCPVIQHVASLCARAVPLSSFDGMWKAGRKEGRGTFTLSNGGVYCGRFQDDVIAGTGQCSRAGSTTSRHPHPPPPTTTTTITPLARPSSATTLLVFRTVPLACLFPGTFTLPLPVEISDTEWMIPFNLQTDVPKIHLRAGFDKKGQ